MNMKSQLKTELNELKSKINSIENNLTQLIEGFTYKMDDWSFDWINDPNYVTTHKFPGSKHKIHTLEPYETKILTMKDLLNVFKEIEETIDDLNGKTK